MAPLVEMFSSGDALAEAAAFAVSQRLSEGLRTRGRAALAATGGRSPGPVYDRLKTAPLDWSRVVVTLSDERRVPAESADSNERLVRERLLTGPAARAAFVPLARPDIETALQALTPFDAVMLGMGEDGHVASLIPGSPVLAEAMSTQRLVADVPAGVGSPPLARITLTLSALLQAKAIFVLIAGDAKRHVVEQAAAGADLPVAALIRQDRTPVRILWAPSH